MHKEGVFYARTDSGLELPVIDVAHPAFKLDVSAEQQRQQIAEFVAAGQPLGALPEFLRKPLLKFFLRKSVLAKGLQKSEGTYLDALTTYLLKLGPDNLEGVSVQEIDRKIAAALPSLTVRLRLQDCAQLMAEWAKPGAPLHGVDVTLNHTAYEWTRTEPLRQVLERAQQAGAVTIASSEGGLFEYGSDAEIVSNLECLRATSEPGLRVVGSVTRADEPIQVMRKGTTAATKPRGLTAFGALCERAGWKIEKTIERAFSDHVRLK